MKKPSNNSSPSAAAQSSSSSSSGAVPSHSSSPVLSFHGDSRPITKLQQNNYNNPVTNKKPPKIRIIHIFAPEIIKTDVANFRELVQRLTGKPTSPPPHFHERKHNKSKSKQFPPSNLTEPSYEGRISDERYGSQQRQDGADFGSYSDEISNGLLGSSSGFEFKEMGTMVKEEGDHYDENQMAWVDSNGNRDGDCRISDGRNEYFEEIDGFIQELGAEFPLMEPNHHYQQRSNYGSHHQLLLHGFGEVTHQFA